MDVWIARQSICDPGRRIVAYELLHRTAEGGPGQGAEASKEVLLHSLFTFGLDRLAEGKHVYVNIPQELLADPRLLLLPNDRVGYEVLEHTEPSPDHLAACRRLRQAGFQVSLDDFWGQPHLLPFLDVVSMVKVEWPACWRPALSLLLDWRSRTGGALLAEKLEDEAQFASARGLGFDLFQGYFCDRPRVHSAWRLPHNAAGRARLLGMLASPEIELEGIAQNVTRDPELSLLMIKWVNSARFARRSPASSVQEALTWLGSCESRRWLMVLLLPTLAGGVHQTVLNAMLTRARLSEEILARLRGPVEGRQAFLVSLTVELAQLNGLSLQEFAQLYKLPAMLVPPIAAILRGQADAPLAGAVLLADRYFDGRWSDCETVSDSLGLNAGELAGLYFSAIKWSASM